MIDVVLYDLDSTLANTYHRQWMVPQIHASKNTGPTWDDYSMACADDLPIPGAVALLKLLSSNGYLSFVVTGRSAAARDLTWEWLRKYEIPVDALLMRPAGDRTPNGKYKVQKIRAIQAQEYNPVLFIEDYPDAAAYIREHTGIPVLLVNADYPADAPHNNENSRGV